MADPQQDAPVPIARVSSGSSSASSARVLPGERSQYPVNMAVDFTRLRPNALRKYLAFHGIPEVPGSSREQLAVTVARHFNQECKKTDEGSSITSFVTYLTGSSDTVEAAEMLRGRPVHRLKRKKFDYEDDDKENQSRQVTISNGGGMRAMLSEEDVDNLFNYGQEDDAGLGGELRPFVVKKRRSTIQDKKHRGANGRGRADSGDAGGTQKKKRKGRLYCTCKGASFGNMIACDNKKCLDRSNWYHMGCVGLDPLEEPPETWYCPACQENDSADIPENQYRKPVASVTYGDMIAHALTVLPGGKVRGLNFDKDTMCSHFDGRAHLGICCRARAPSRTSVTSWRPSTRVNLTGSWRATNASLQCGSPRCARSSSPTCASGNTPRSKACSAWPREPSATSLLFVLRVLRPLRSVSCLPPSPHNRI